MKDKIFVIFIFCVLSLSAVAEDVAERAYHVPSLKPKHTDKPEVKGWAQHRADEKLDRGLIAMEDGQGNIYLGWRFLKSDAEGTTFNIYRSTENGEPVRLNNEPIAVTTDYADKQVRTEDKISYQIRPVLNGRELESSEKVFLKTESEAGLYRSIQFQGDYSPDKIGVGDLDGDGDYDFVIKQPSGSIDPAGRANKTGSTYKLEAYLSNGKFLWRYDLGLGIEPGVWYSPFVVYDLDGDGRAEVAVKTGPADARGEDGRVREGPELCSILDGMTGEEITRADWSGRDPRLGDYNRINRNQIGMAYLDGKTPCLLIARGTYKFMVLDAYQYHGRKLERLWHWDGDEEIPVIRSQGAHSMHAVDVDGDGRDEVVLGSVTIDDNGTALWSTGYGHPDKCIVTDIDPGREGLEIFYAIEPWRDDGNGVCLVDAKTGRTLWNIGHKTYHVGDGMAADIDPHYPGMECFAIEDSRGGSAGRSRERYMFASDGSRIGKSEDVPGCTNWAFWDGDLLRETFQWNWRGRGGSLSVVKCKGDVLTSGLKGRIVLIADILGDWREELITVLPGELRIYTTTIAAKDRRVCLMQDPVYRSGVAHRSMGYEQSPVTSYYLAVSPADSKNSERIIEKTDLLATEGKGDTGEKNTE